MEIRQLREVTGGIWTFADSIGALPGKPAQSWAPEVWGDVWQPGGGLVAVTVGGAGRSLLISRTLGSSPSKGISNPVPAEDSCVRVVITSQEGDVTYWRGRGPATQPAEGVSLVIWDES